MGSNPIHPSLLSAHFFDKKSEENKSVRKEKESDEDGNVLFIRWQELCYGE